MTGLDQLMEKAYDRKTYNCAHFAADVWKMETGEDILSLLTPLMPIGAPKAPKALASMFRNCHGRPGPGVRAIVVMRRPKSASHVGIYLRGRVIHLHEKGPEFMPPEIAARGFTTVSYYARRP